ALPLGAYYYGPDAFRNPVNHGVPRSRDGRQCQEISSMARVNPAATTEATPATSNQFMRCFMGNTLHENPAVRHPTTVPIPQDVVGQQKQLRPCFMGNRKQEVSRLQRRRDYPRQSLGLKIQTRAATHRSVQRSRYLAGGGGLKLRGGVLACKVAGRGVGFGG